MPYSLNYSQASHKPTSARKHSKVTMHDHTSTWPPGTPSGVSTPTVPRSSQVFAIHASTTINAPAAFIFKILLNTTTYPEWCTFIPKVDIDSQANDEEALLKVGSRIIFHACMGTPGSSTRATPLVVTDISTPAQPSAYVPEDTLASDPTYTSDLSIVYRVAWASDRSSAFSVEPSAERFHEVIVRGEQQCEVRTWECMGGAVAHVVKWMYKSTLEAKFSDWCWELKDYGERKWEKEKDGGGMRAV